MERVRDRINFYPFGRFWRDCASLPRNTTRVVSENVQHSLSFLSFSLSPRPYYSLSLWLTAKSDKKFLKTLQNTGIETVYRWEFDKLAMLFSLVTAAAGQPPILSPSRPAKRSFLGRLRHVTELGGPTPDSIAKLKERKPSTHVRFALHVLVNVCAHPVSLSREMSDPQVVPMQQESWLMMARVV